MLRLLKVLAVLIVLIAIGLTGYAYLGDLEPERGPVAVPVTLGDAD